MPISGRHDLPLATFNLPSRVFRHGVAAPNVRNNAGEDSEAARSPEPCAIIPPPMARKNLVLCRSQALLGNASREAPLRIPLARVAPMRGRAPRPRGWTLERPHTHAAAGAAAHGG